MGVAHPLECAMHGAQNCLELLLFSSVGIACGIISFGVPIDRRHFGMSSCRCSHHHLRPNNVNSLMLPVRSAFGTSEFRQFRCERTGAPSDCNRLTPNKGFQFELCSAADVGVAVIGCAFATPESDVRLNGTRRGLAISTERTIFDWNRGTHLCWLPGSDDIGDRAGYPAVRGLPVIRYSAEREKSIWLREANKSTAKRCIFHFPIQLGVQSTFSLRFQWPLDARYSLYRRLNVACDATRGRNAKQIDTIEAADSARIENNIFIINGPAIRERFSALVIQLQSILGASRLLRENSFSVCL